MSDAEPPRLTKPSVTCQVSALLAVALAAAGGNAQAPDRALRDCVRQAHDGAALAACEAAAQAALKTRIEQLSTAIRARLVGQQRALFDRNEAAWRSYLTREIALIDLTFGQRADGLAGRLRAGAVTALYEQRERQLREHLINLQSAR